MTRVMLLAACLVACGTAHVPEGDAGHDAAIDAGLDARVVDLGEDASVDAGVDAGPTAVRCGATDCAVGEACCFDTGACFDPIADPTACPVPPDGECRANEHCAEGQVCIALDGTCLGEGRCIDPGGCGGDSEPVCGCDGETYPSRCAAHRAGVRVGEVGSGGACGQPQLAAGGRRRCDDDGDCPADGRCDMDEGFCVWGPPRVACGHDGQCPEGSDCCPYTGACFDASCDDCCRQPPPGTYFPCRQDSECHQFDIFHFCQSVGCGGALGGCRGMPSSCGGELSPVCGCDGSEYTNECWAWMEGVDVDPDGLSCL